jgi:adenine-specific DNA methylase
VTAPWEIVCPHCGMELPARGNRRVAVPSRHGRKMLVHAGCADEIERQEVLDVQAVDKAVRAGERAGLNPPTFPAPKEAA